MAEASYLLGWFFLQNQRITVDPTARMMSRARTCQNPLTMTRAKPTIASTVMACRHSFQDGMVSLPFLLIVIARPAAFARRLILGIGLFALHQFDQRSHDSIHDDTD